jgi:hypothetical protein
MSLQKKITKVFLVAASVGLVVNQPAWSGDFSNFLKDMVNNMGQQPRSQSQSQVVNPAPDSIQQRETDLANRMIAAINANKLSFADSQTLKQQLDQLKLTENNFRNSGGGLDSVEIASLNSELSRIDANFTKMIGGSTTTNPPPGTIGGATPLDSFEATRKQFAGRIDRGVSSGRLTNAEATDLRADLSRLEQMEASFRTGGQPLNPQQIALLKRGYDNLHMQLRNQLHDDETASNPGIPSDNINQREAALGRKIDDAVATGRLQTSDAEMLRRMLQFVEGTEWQFRQTGGTLDAAETSRLNQDLDRVQARLDRMIASAPTPSQLVDQKKAALLKNLNDASTGNRLSPLEAKMIQSEYDQITWLQQRLSSNGKLEQSDAQKLISDIDSYNSWLNTALTDVRPPFGHRGEGRMYHTQGNWQNQ